MIARLAFALLAIGAAVAGFHWSQRSIPTGELAPHASGDPPPVRVNDPDPADGWNGGVGSDSFETASSGPPPPPPPAPAGSTPDPSTPADLLPTREQLEVRAAKVEQEANHELQNLLGVLDLSPDDQDRVFSALVRKSSAYHPSFEMRHPGGAPIAPPIIGAPVDIPAPPRETRDAPPSEGSLAAAPDVTDPVLDALPRELIPRYREYRSAREEFWAGVVETIDRQIQESTPGQ